MSLFIPWLIAWGSCTVAFLLFLLSINIIMYYRELKRKNTPKPVDILIKSILTFPFFIYVELAGLKLKSANLSEFVNKTVWINWDIRWLAADSTQGEILEVISNSLGNGLLIQLYSPIINTSENVVFYPHPSMSSFQFRYASVSGKIFPVHNPKYYEISGTLIIL
jgi:hypothetical protein